MYTIYVTIAGRFGLQLPLHPYGLYRKTSNWKETKIRTTKRSAGSEVLTKALLCNDSITRYSNLL